MENNNLSIYKFKKSSFLIEMNTIIYTPNKSRVLIYNI